MTGLLLDHPWQLDEALDPASEGFGVLEKFVSLVRETQLDVVPFVSRSECDEMWQRIQYGRFARTRGWASLVSFAEHLVVRVDRPTPLATPIPEPPQLTPCWKRALRQSMGDLRDWRNPQIIVGPKRQSAWPKTHEVTVKIEDADGADLQHRVLAHLENYNAHPFTRADLDPWDLTNMYPPVPEPERQHPCRLPRPPSLFGAPLERLREGLIHARAVGWQVNERCYFIPPEDWRAQDVTKERWRSGRTFRHERVPQVDHAGPLDYAGRVWVWDRAERHWDVQEPEEYRRISHTGDRL
jgi:hypothetical protein